MKKLFLFHLAMVISFLLLGNIVIMAQYTPIPNHDFSQWHEVGVTKPVGWLVEDHPRWFDLTTSKSTDAASGEFAIRLETVPEDQEDDGLARGVLGLMGEFYQPLPWTEPVDRIHLSVKYDVEPEDAALVAVFLIKEVNDEYEMIATMVHYLENDSENSWEHLSLPLEFEEGYDNTTIPDYIQAIIVSSVFDPADDDPLPLHSYTPAAGSWIIADNIYFTLNNDTGNPVYPVNHDLEEWEFSGTSEPVNWETANNSVTSEYAPPVTKFEDTDAGITAVRIETVPKAWGNPAGEINLVDDDYVRGISYTEQPSVITFFYKYEPVDNDDAHINLFFSGWLDGEYQQYHGGHFHNITEATDGFVQGSFGLWVDEDFTPERLKINIFSGENHGSVLYITGLEFAELHDITFHVNDDESGNPVPWANVSIEGYPWPWQTAENGRVTIGLPVGFYDYSITAMGYEKYTGTLNVSGDDLEHVLMMPYEPDPESIVIRITDGDPDKVYFEGNWFQADVTLPASAPAIPDNSVLEASVVLYTEPGIYDENIEDIFEGVPNISPIQGNIFTIQGNIGSNSTTGVIGLKITGFLVETPGDPMLVPLDDPIVFPLIDTYDYAYYSQEGSDRGMAIVGVSIPDGEITSQPLFSDIIDLYNMHEGISFVKDGHGSIYFPWLNVIDNRDQLHMLNDGLNIYADSDGEGFYVEIDLSILPFLQSHWVDVTLHNIPLDMAIEDIMVLRTNFGEAADNLAEQAWNTDSYHLEDGVFSFKIHDGFSRYSLMLADDPVAVILPENKETGVYPNPFTDVINITGGDAAETITVTNLSGSVVLQQALNGTNSVDTSRLPAGFYIVTLKIESGKIMTLPMVKK